MRNQVIVDLKLLATGVGIGALICAAFIGQQASHTCGTVALIAVVIALAFRHFEKI